MLQFHVQTITTITIRINHSTYGAFNFLRYIACTLLHEWETTEAGENMYDLWVWTTSDDKLSIKQHSLQISQFLFLWWPGQPQKQARLCFFIAALIAQAVRAIWISLAGQQSLLSRWYYWAVSLDVCHMSRGYAHSWCSFFWMTHTAPNKLLLSYGGFTHNE